MSKTLAITLIIGALLLISSCSTAKPDLKILTENYPPLSYAEDGVATGFGSDVVNAIQADLGIDYPIEVQSWDEAYATALNEANVVLFTMDKTPKREESFYFIGPLGSNVASFYANSEQLVQLQDIDEAKSCKAIGTTTNWFTEQYLLEQGFENLASKGDPLETLRMLANKEVDLAVFTDVTLPELCREANIGIETLSPVLELLSTDYYIAISKASDAKVVEDWQKAFARLQESGKLEELRTKWFAE